MHRWQHLKHLMFLLSINIDRVNTKMKALLTEEDIKRLALENGFKLKQQPSGEMELNPYVYDLRVRLLMLPRIAKRLTSPMMDCTTTRVVIQR